MSLQLLSGRQQLSARRPSTCPAWHTLDVAHDAVVVSPLLAPVVTGVAGPGNATISGNTNPSGTPVGGFRLTVNPGGKVLTYLAATHAATLPLADNIVSTVTAQAIVGSLTSPATAIRVELRTGGSSARPATGTATAGTTSWPSTRRPTLVLYRGNGHSGFLSGSTVAQTWNQPLRSVFRDVVEQGQLSRTWTAAYGGDLGQYQPSQNPVCLGGFVGGFQRFRTVFAGDLTPAHTPDILGIDDAGGLWLYPGIDNAVLLSTSKRINSGWGSMTTVFDWGDQTGDRHNDLLAIRNDGAMVLHRATARVASQAAAARSTPDGTSTGRCSPPATSPATDAPT